MSQQGSELHIVTGQQFLDSPEWFGVNTDDYFQVIVASQDEFDICSTDNQLVSVYQPDLV